MTQKAVAIDNVLALIGGTLKEVAVFIKSNPRNSLAPQLKKCAAALTLAHFMLAYDEEGEVAEDLRPLREVAEESRRTLAAAKTLAMAN